MTVRLSRLMRMVRFALLVFGSTALSYSSWIYFEGYWRERRESEDFDRSREAHLLEGPSAEKVFMARLTIPRLDLVTMVEGGVEEDTLRFTAGHIPGTALPGGPGNVGVAAHRDTSFRGLRRIRKHDRILLSTLGKDYYYEVVSISIVRPEEVSVLAPSRGQKTLTLVTCYPFYFIGNAPKRFIVRALQIEQRLAGQSGGAKHELPSDGI